MLSVLTKIRQDGHNVSQKQEVVQARVKDICQGGVGSEGWERDYGLKCQTKEFALQSVGIMETLKIEMHRNNDTDLFPQIALMIKLVAKFFCLLPSLF